MRQPAWRNTLRTTTTTATVAGILFTVIVQHSTSAASIPPEEPRMSDSEPTAIVQVQNVAGIAADLLQVAENRAGDVFHKIGARLIWDDTTTQQHFVVMFTLVLANVDQTRGPYWDAQDALGFAAPPAHRAWVFWDHIEAEKARAPTIAILLGDVMAHELGHLLLSSTGHSLRGIMRGNVPLRMQATETFTKRQALDILNRLEDRQAARRTE